MSKTTVSEHAIAAHHAFHNTAAALHKTAAAGEKTDASFHKGMAAAHEECAGKLAECMKALAAADLEKSRQLPAGITNVTPERPTVRPIPRTGAPAPGERTAPNVPLEFVKLFSVDDENEEVERPIL
jgi:hypothetical protein